jgi:signal transduction histidine kinase
VQGLGFAARVRDADRPTAEATWRARGAPPGFAIHPAGKGADAVSVTYLEPMDARNRAAIGFDMATEPVRRAAMEQARDTGAPALSARVTLVQETAGPVQPGFLLYVPVYEGVDVPASVTARRARLVGYVYAPFRATDLFRGVFGDGDRPKLDMAVYDGPVADPAHLLYQGEPTQRAPYRPRFESATPLTIAGHPWTFEAKAPPEFAFDAPVRLPLYLLLAGLLLSLLLFTNAWVLATGRRRALALAEGMTSELRQADRAKDEFLSVISHELRTPLNFIMGFGSILEDEIAGPLNGSQREYVGKIMNGADRMLVLVNDLLDFAKLQAGKFTLTPTRTPYAAIVDEAIATIRPLAAQKRLALDAQVAVPEPVCLDGKRVGQVLSNLLSNAIKFTPDGGSVRVKAFVKDGAVVTEVTDTGIGIAPEDVSKLFTRFKQLDMSATRQAGGTGLGLSIAKALVEAHGGAIAVRSAPQVGSTFSFTLPLDSPLPGCRVEES